MILLLLSLLSLLLLLLLLLLSSSRWMEFEAIFLNRMAESRYHFQCVNLMNTQEYVAVRYVCF